MIKTFRIEENKNAGFLKHVFNEMISLEFVNKSDEEKLQLLKMLDEVITENSDIPSANIYFGSLNVENTNNIYLNNYKETNDGLEVLLMYFYEKRKQYQKYCIENNDNGSYSKDIMEEIKNCYEVSPITGIKAEVEFKEDSYKNYFNVNNFDAFMYASEQLDQAIGLIDFGHKMEGYDIFERIKFIFMIRRSLNSKTRKLAKVAKVFDNERAAERIYKVIGKRADLIEEEKIEIEVLKRNLVDLKDNEKGYLFMGVCFNENIWKNLKSKERDIAIKGFSKLIANMNEVDCYDNIKYDKYLLLNLDVIKNKSICVGDIRDKTAREVATSIAYAYSITAVYKEIINCEDEDYKTMLLEDYLACKKCIKEENYDELKNSQFINKVSDCAVSLLKTSYEVISNSALLTGKSVAMDCSKEDFLYHYYNNITRGGR